MRPHHEDSEQGAIVIVLFTVLIPLLLLVGAFTTTMAARSKEFGHVVDEERALVAAESGIDQAIYEASQLNLVSGTVYRRSLGGGMAFSIAPTYLGADGKDNDRDGAVDEPDEDVFQVVVTGSYRDRERKIAAYLGPVPALPTFHGAVAFFNPAVDLVLGAGAEVQGNNRTLAGGVAANPALYPGYGMTISSAAGTTAELGSTLGSVEGAAVQGATGAPSLGTSSVTWSEVRNHRAQLENIADLVLTSGDYEDHQFGQAAAPGGVHVAYRNGDLAFSGHCQGAGVLLVTGDLHIAGTFRFDGVLIVLGDVLEAADSAQIFGALLQGPAGTRFELSGNAKVSYSAEAIDLASRATGSYVAFNGWQEVSQ